MSFPRYPKYKHSGVDWLGEVPEHWGVVPCRAILTERSGTNEDGSITDYLSLMANIGVIPYEEKGDVGNKKPEDLRKCKLVKIGDFVINSMNYGIGSYGESQYDGVCSQVYIVMTPNHLVVQPRFAFRLLESKQFQTLAQSFGNGILAHRAAINWGILKSMFVCLPDMAEQAVIQDFLEHETDKIDALIAEQQHLIELLKEKRQAVISQAVTKGLNPKAPLKDSGIDWLGRIPSHWTLCQLGFVATLDTGATPDRAIAQYWNGEIPWIKTGEINYKRIGNAEEHITETGLQNSAARIAPPGTLLMAMYGQGATRGRVAILDIEAAYNQATAAIRLKESVEVEYAYYFFIHAYSFFRNDGNETSQMNLSSGSIRKIKLAFPPLQEQIRIIQQLQVDCKRIDELTTEAEANLSLLSERRAAIISAAVTGKIDVRNFSPTQATAS
jgi:type I restriction enzyme S subunit